MGRLKFSISIWLVLVLGACSSPETAPHKEYTENEKAKLLVEVANGALAEGDWTGALQYLARAERLNKDMPELYHSRALAMYKKHDLKAAIEAAKKAIEIRPEYPEANSTLGKLLMEASLYKEAVPHLEKAANNPLYRDAYKALSNLGILKYRLGEYLQAETYFNRAIQDSPMEACIARYYRGHIKLRNSLYQEAIQDYSDATKKLCTSFGDAHLALGIAYEKNRQYDLARKTFLEIQRRYPNTKLAEQAVDQLKYLP